MSEGYTNFEKVANLLDELGIEYTTDTDEEGSKYINLDADRSDGVIGYPGFFAVWVFEEDEEFRELGLYE